MPLTYHHTFGDTLPDKYRHVADRLSALFPEAGARLLDVGCHTGSFAAALRARTFEVVGLERDEAAAAVARKAGVPVIVADASAPASLEKLGDARFDAILCLDVLEHLADPAATLRALVTRLMPKGRVLVTGPNVAYWANRKNLLAGRWDYRDAGILDRTHLRFYTALGWRRLLEGAGLDVQRCEPADGMLPLESWLQRVPLATRWLSPFRQAALAAFPTLFTIDYFFEAVPRSMP